MLGVIKLICLRYRYGRDLRLRLWYGHDVLRTMSFVVLMKETDLLASETA